MFETEWKEDNYGLDNVDAAPEGYWYKLISFKDGLPPILILRVVKTSDGKWEPIIRDSQSGILIVGSKRGDLAFAMGECLRLKDELFLSGISEGAKK